MATRGPRSTRTGRRIGASLNNQQIPITIYGLAFSSTTGLKEEFLISRADAAPAFVEAFAGLHAAARTAQIPAEEDEPIEPGSSLDSGRNNAR